MNHRNLLAAASASVMLGSALLAASPASATDRAAGNGYGSKTVHTYAKLRALNKSGMTGKAHVTAKGTNLNVQYSAYNLLKKAPHAVHIHYGEQARHECPTLRDDTNGDNRLTTLEGVPAYGPVAVSLTTAGDTSPTSALAVDRYSTALKGKIHYHRKTSPPTPPPPRASATATPCSSSTVSTTTTTASTTSPPARATSTRSCPPRPPTRRPAACCTADPSGTSRGPPPGWGVRGA